METLQLPTVYSSLDFDFDEYALETSVMAFNNALGSWEQIELYDVMNRVDRYMKFFIVDDIPTPEKDSQVNQVKDKVNEMIAWINKWSLKAPAVDDQLNEYRNEIFEILDELEESQS